MATEATDNLRYYETRYAAELVRGRDPNDFGMKWIAHQIELWRKDVQKEQNEI